MLREILVAWAVLTLAVWVATKIVPGVRIRGGAASHLIVSAVFGLLSAVLQTLLFHVIAIGTLGIGYLVKFLTMLVVTMVLLKVTDAITKRFQVASWKASFFASIVVTIVGVVASWLLAL